MARFIDSDKLIWQVQNNDKYGTITKQVFISLLQNSETEDVAPVVHAHWTRKRTQEHDGELYCSNCEWTPEVMGCTTLGDLQLADVYFCPHCSAKMGEEV